VPGGQLADARQSLERVTGHTSVFSPLEAAYRPVAVTKRASPDIIVIQNLASENGVPRAFVPDV